MIFDVYLRIFECLNLPQKLLAPLYELCYAIFAFIIVAAVMMLAVLFLVLAERRILALFTIRKGPNRVGYNGLLQTVADAIKLLFKEDIISKNADKFLFTLAPIVFFVPSMLVFGLIPIGKNIVAIDSPVGFLLLLSLSAIGILGLVIAGWSSNNKYALLGAMRAVAQSISYEIPLLTSGLAVVVLSQSMNLTQIAIAQKNIFHWNIFPSLIGFVVFFICSLAELNRVPFDLPEAESELVSGYNTEYSGMKFALFFLAEYACLFAYSALIATLFFGGFSSPFGVFIMGLLPILKYFVFIEQIFWLMLKTFAIIFAIMWIRATLPRLRADQLMGFAWKFLLPLSIFNLIFVALFKFYVG